MEQLQAAKNQNADIIPGVIHDDLMADRVQVILVITGLGATAVGPEQASERISERTPERRVEPADNPVPFEIRGQQKQDAIPLEISAKSSNMDIPAFLRRRIN